jgi:diguanylate cyclase (GGDEF)-like protein
LAYLDMNGLKQVNDTKGHQLGDVALKAYLHAVATAVADRGEAYRLGGDEVLAIIPGHHLDAAVPLLRSACMKLMNEQIIPTSPELLLSISVGLVMTCDSSVSPTALREKADQVQYKAKQASKETIPRPSVIAVEGKDDMILIKHSS